MRNVDPEANDGEIISVPERSLDASEMEDDKINKSGFLVRNLKCQNSILRKRNCVLKIREKSLAKRCKEYKHELDELRKKYDGNDEQCSHSTTMCVHKELLNDALKEILQIKQSVFKLKPGNLEENVPKETLNVQRPPEVNPASNYVCVELDPAEITIDLHDDPQDPQVITETVDEGEIPIENITRDTVRKIPGGWKELRVVPKLEHASKIVTNSTKEKVTKSMKRKLPKGFASDCKALPNMHVTTTNSPKRDDEPFKAFKCTVAGCGKEFNRRGWLRRHLTSHGGVTPSYDDFIARRHKCTIDGCGQIFVVKRDLCRHISEHAKEAPFACSFDGCSMKFSRSEDLQSHDEIHNQAVDEVNASEKPLMCSFHGCDQSFMNVDDHAYHIRTHQIENPFKCPFFGCGRRFSDREDRRLHSHTHTHDAEKPFRCSFYGCGQKYATESKLADHSRVHTDEERPFKCPFNGCVRSYNKELALESHCNSHRGFYLYACRLTSCKRKFSKKSVLNKHMKWHEKYTKNASIKSDVS